MHGTRFDTFAGNVIGNGFGVDCRLENRAARRKLPPKPRSIDEIAIVSKHERSFDVGKDERLRVLRNGRARRGIANMPDA